MKLDPIKRRKERRTRSSPNTRLVSTAGVCEVCGALGARQVEFDCHKLSRNQSRYCEFYDPKNLLISARETVTFAICVDCEEREAIPSRDLDEAQMNNEEE